jgi:phosphatidylglycerophosphate synthase
VTEELTEGELWAREQLAALLAARFTPAAIGRFLIASQRRTNQVRAARPELARRAWGWMAAGGAAWAALAAAGEGPFRRRLRAGLAWWAATAVMLDWHLGMVETEDGRPRQLSSADALTLLRAWLVPVALDSPTPAVCGVAAATDVLDGWMARRGEPTRIGRDLEGLVDTCFSAAALRAARRDDRIGSGVVAGELARLAAGFGYALYVYFGRASAPDPRVTRAARVTTPVRVAGLIAAGIGRRRLAGALVGGGAAWSVVAVARALRERG